MADRFMKGTLILTAAGLLVKILGSVNRILLSRLLGGEGIGLYQIAYPFYLMLVALSSAGVPAAMSILIAQKVAQKDFWGARRTMELCGGLMAFVGVLFAALAWGLIPVLISHGWVKDGRAGYAMLALVPAVGLSIPLACFRGYFQGFQEMTPTAVSQIGEQFTRVMVMVLLAYALLPQGLSKAAAGAAFGSVPGALVGILLLLWFYQRQKKRYPDSPSNMFPQPTFGETAKRLLSLALPVTCANLMVPIVSVIEILLVPERLLVAGFTVAASTRALGYLSGMALPLVNMGTIPTNSLALSTVPALSEAKALGDMNALENKTKRAFRFFLLLNLPAAVGVYLLGTPIAQVLYGTVHAGPVITALAPAILFLGLHQVTTAMLQGLGHTKIPMANMFLSLLVKIAVLWVLVANPAYHILGAAWATNINLAIAGILNLFFLARKEHLALPWKSLLRIALASFCMALVIKTIQPFVFWGPLLQLPFLVLLGMLVYGFCLFLTGEVRGKRLGK